jgi:hypothetical protein
MEGAAFGLLDGGCHAGNEAAAADGDKDVGEIRHLLQDLQADGPLAGHDQIIIEGVDKEGTALPAGGHGSGIGLIEIASGEHHLGAIVAGGEHLLRRSALRHVDRCPDPEKIGGKSHPLGMIAGGSRNDAFHQRFPRLGGHEIEGAADLEGAGSLQVFTLEPERNPCQFAEMVGVDQLGPPDPFFQAVLGFVDKSIIKGRVSCHGVVIDLLPARLTDRQRL